MWPHRMCASCTRAVSFDAMHTVASAMAAAAPPPAPVNATVKAPNSRAFRNAEQTFLLFPDVEIPITTSPSSHRASTWREKHRRSRSRLRSRSGSTYPSSERSPAGPAARAGSGRQTQPPDAARRPRFLRCRNSSIFLPSIMARVISSAIFSRIGSWAGKVSMTARWSANAW